MNENIDITKEVRKLVLADLPVVDMRGKEFRGQTLDGYFTSLPHSLVKVFVDGRTLVAYDYTMSTLARNSMLPPFLRRGNGYCVLVVSDVKDLQSKVALVVDDLLC